MKGEFVRKSSEILLQFKADAFNYYNAFYNNRVAPPICIAFCSVIIVAYIMQHFG